MKSCLPPHTHTFRCMVFPYGDGYIAECIDLNIAVRRPIPELAVDALEDAMFSCLSVAMQGDTTGLIPRPSPLSHWIRYYFAPFFSAQVFGLDEQE